MAKGQISVVIPNFNQGATIAQAIESCVNQSRSPLEIIVVDDGSTDDSRKILARLNQSIDCMKLVLSDRNEGAVRAQSKGAELALGDYLVFRAGDDLSLPGFFESAAAQLDRFPEAGLCCGDTNYFYDDPERGRVERTGLSEKSSYLDPDLLSERFSGDHLIHGASVMVRKESFFESGGFEERHKWYADWYCFLVTAFRRGVCYVPQAFAAFRLNANSYGSAGSMRLNEQKDALLALALSLRGTASEINQRIERCGALAFLGPGFQGLADATDECWSDEMLAMFRSVDSSRTTCRKLDFGIGGSVREALSGNRTLIEEAVSDARSIYVYGAGRHSEILFDVWKEEGFGVIAGVMTTDSPRELYFRGVPVLAIDEVEGDVGLIVLSSKSYERAMAEKCRIHYPETAIINIWTR